MSCIVCLIELEAYWMCNLCKARMCITCHAESTGRCDLCRLREATRDLSDSPPTMPGLNHNGCPFVYGLHNLSTVLSLADLAHGNG